MAKVLCAFSGISFNCEHLSLALNSREYAHPIFFLPQKKLLGLYQKYRHQELTDTESYLVFLAYLRSTGLVQFNSPAQVSPRTSGVIANNFDSLVYMCERMNCYRNAAYPQIAISTENRTLDTVQYWIAAWEVAYDDHRSGAARLQKSKELGELEERLQSLVNDANRDEAKFSARLAEWAAKAGDFPRSNTLVSGQYLPLAEYWKQIIRKCTNQESIFGIPSADLAELIAHCEDNISAGSIYGYNLFKILREGRSKQDSFLGAGEFNFTILSEDSGVEAANKISIIQNAPESEPRRVDYPSQFAYIKAKLAWEMKERYNPPEATETADCASSSEGEL